MDYCIFYQSRGDTRLLHFLSRGDTRLPPVRTGRAHRPAASTAFSFPVLLQLPLPGTQQVAPVASAAQVRVVQRVRLHSPGEARSVVCLDNSCRASLRTHTLPCLAVSAAAPTVWSSMCRPCSIGCTGSCGETCTSTLRRTRDSACRVTRPCTSLSCRVCCNPHRQELSGSPLQHRSDWFVWSNVYVDTARYM